MLARYLLSPCCLSVRLSVSHSLAGRYCIERLNESSWYLALSRTALKFEYVQKLGYFPLDLCPKLRIFGKFRHGKSVALSTTLVVVVDG